MRRWRDPRANERHSWPAPAATMRRSDWRRSRWSPVPIRPAHFWKRRPPARRSSAASLAPIAWKSWWVPAAWARCIARRICGWGATLP